MAKSGISHALYVTGWNSNLCHLSAVVCVSALHGWVNLFPEHLVVDEDSHVFTISKLARNEHLVIVPEKLQALRVRQEGQTTYRVHAEIPNGTVFEVIGRIGEPGDSFPYRVGLFASYELAFTVAGSVNINGARGVIRLVFDYEPVHRTVEEYHEHKRHARYNDQAYYLHSVVEITKEPAGNAIALAGSIEEEI